VVNVGGSYTHEHNHTSEHKSAPLWKSAPLCAFLGRFQAYSWVWIGIDACRAPYQLGNLPQLNQTREEELQSPVALPAGGWQTPRSIGYA
jgi:hypothetical protein